MLLYLDGLKFKIKPKNKKFIELKNKKLFSKTQEKNLKVTLGEYYPTTKKLLVHALKQDISHLEIHHIGKEDKPVFYIETGFYISVKNKQIDIKLKDTKFGISRINTEWINDDNRECAKRLNRSILEISNKYKALGLI